MQVGVTVDELLGAGLGAGIFPYRKIKEGNKLFSPHQLRKKRQVPQKSPMRQEREQHQDHLILRQGSLDLKKSLAKNCSDLRFTTNFTDCVHVFYGAL